MASIFSFRLRDSFLQAARLVAEHLAELAYLVDGFLAQVFAQRHIDLVCRFDELPHLLHAGDAQLARLARQPVQFFAGSAGVHCLELLVQLLHLFGGHAGVFDDLALGFLHLGILIDTLAHGQRHAGQRGQDAGADGGVAVEAVGQLAQGQAGFCGGALQFLYAGIDFLQLLIVLLPFGQAGIDVAQDGVQLALPVGQFLQAQVPDANLVEQVVILLLQVAHHGGLCLILLAVLAELFLQLRQFATGISHLLLQLNHLLPGTVLLNNDFQLYSVYFQAHVFNG